MTFKNKRSLIALVMSLVLVLSFFTVSVFAQELTAEQVKEVKNTLIINGAIILAIIVIAVALIIRFHKKLFGFLRTVKSELKKIVWSSKENTRKSFLVVVVVAVAFALGTFLIDFALGEVVKTLSTII
jgi:preprotein translocase subunit SecE